MIPVRIEGATRVMGKPENWDEDSSTHCSELAIRDIVDQDRMLFMVSAWQPTPAELAALNRGESVKLWINGTVHPVVCMSVGDIG